jgi:hypothetical protein
MSIRYLPYNGKDLYILDLAHGDFQNYEVIGTAENICNGGEDHTLKNQGIPVFQNVRGPYDGTGNDSLGQVLYGRSEFNKNDKTPTQVKITEMWQGRNIPYWAYRYYTVAEKSNLGAGSAQELRSLWQSNFSETMDTQWSIDLIRQLYFEAADVDNNGLMTSIEKAGQFQLMYSESMSDPLKKGPLMFKSFGFAVQATRALLGITGPGYFSYYFKSKINLRGHLVTTKDGINRIRIKYKQGGNAQASANYGRGSTSDWIELCGNAFLFINSGTGYNEQVTPSYEVDLGPDVIEPGDETFILEGLFNYASETPPPEFLAWWNKVCDGYDSIQELYDNNGLKPFTEAQSDKVKFPDDYKASGVRFGGVDFVIDTNGPGALFAGSRFAFGTDPTNGGLWLGNLHFIVGFNPRNAGSQVWSQMRARQQNYRPIIQQKAQDRAAAASGGSTGKSDLNLNGSGQTSTANGTRPSNTDAVAQDNASSSQNTGGKGGSNNDNQVAIPTDGPPL